MALADRERISDTRAQVPAYPVTPNVPNLDALMAAQIAAEDAVLAQGLEVWSVADPDAGEVVLHLSGARSFTDTACYVFDKRRELMRRLAR